MLKTVACFLLCQLIIQSRSQTKKFKGKTTKFNDVEIEKETKMYF